MKKVGLGEEKVVKLNYELIGKKISDIEKSQILRHNLFWESVLRLEALGDFQRALDLLSVGFGQTAKSLYLVESISIILSYGRLADARILLSLGETIFGTEINDTDPLMQQKKIVEFLSAGKKVISINDKSDSFLFNITGENREIEAEHLEGRLFEKNELQIINDFVPLNGTFLDIGANTGNHSIFCAVKRPDVEVIPIEAEPRAVKILKKNITLNKLTNVNLKYLGKAINIHVGVTFLQWRGSISSTYAVDKSSIVAQNLVLTDILREKSFMKMDIEGLEPSIIEKSASALKIFKTIAMVEVLNSNSKKIEKVFEKFKIEMLKKVPIYDHKNEAIGANWVMRFL